MTGLAFGAAGVDWQERINFSRMRQERLAKAQAAMKKHGIAACLLNRTENIRYVTGVRGPIFAPQIRYALAFAEHDPIVYELGDVLEHNKVDCPWIKPENWRFSYSWWGGIGGIAASRIVAKKWAHSLATDLKAKGVFREKLGTDGLDDLSRQALKEAGVETISVMPALIEARRTKTQDEINCTRMAVAIANTAYYTFCEVAKPGLRECDVGAAAWATLLQAGAENAMAGVTSGTRGFDLHHIRSTDRVIQMGDLAYLQLCGTSYNGYQVCIYRTFIVGRKPNQKEKDFYKRCYERVYSVIEAIKPGATTADAAKHFLPASTWGYEAEERLLASEVGHGVGLTTHEEPGISRIWSFDAPQTFEPGMVIAVECREGEPGYGGVRLEEMVVVTDTGHEIITTWPSQELIPVAKVLE